MQKMRKKGRSRILSGVLAICMVISLMPTVSAAAAADYTDVSSGDWYYDSVKYVSEHKYFEGTGGGAFSPNAPMTRAMFVTVLSRLENVTAGDEVSPFDDVASGSWYAGEVAWAVDKKLANGTGDGMFSPENSVTRQDMAAFMSRYISYYTANHEVTLKAAGAAKSFTDESSIAAYAKDAVALCTSYGLIDGYPDGSFAPSDTATRAQVATVIYRLALLLEGGNGEESEAASAGGTGGGHKSSISEQTAATAADFEAAAEAGKKNVTATIEDTNYLTVNDDVTIDNGTASVLTLNIGKANLGKLTINAQNAKEIKINTGSEKAASLSSLVINAPYASVTNDVKVNGPVEIQAVSAGTFNNTAETGIITISGPGAINDTQETPAQIVVNTDKDVIVKGNSAAISVVADSAKLTVATAKAPTVESSAAKVKLTVSTKEPVTVEGTVAKIEATAKKPVLAVNGTVDSIEAKDASSIEVKGTGSVSTMETGNADVKVAEDAKLSVETVKASGGKIEAPANTISIVKVEKNADVELKAPVETVAAAEGAKLTLDKNASVTTLEAEGSLTLSGNGEVTSVDVQSENAQISVESSDLTVTQVTADESIANSVTVSGLDEIKVQTKAAKPTGVSFEAPVAAGGSGKLTGVTNAMEYRAANQTEWQKVNVDASGKAITVGSGTYLVRVAATNTSLASEPITVTIPKAVGVNKAEIQGTAYIGKTLTAVANADATASLHYEWMVGETVIGTDSKTLTLADDMTVKGTENTLNIIGQTITVRIYNYDGKTASVSQDDANAAGTQDTATSTATAAVTVDKSTLEKLLAKSSEIQNGVTVKADGTAANAVAEGVVFVTTSEKTALENAITAAGKVNVENASSSAVSAQERALRAANEAFIKAKKTGTRTDADVFKADLTALLWTAPAVASNDAASKIRINDDAKKVEPGVQWVTQAVADAYSGVKTAAESAKNKEEATKDELSTAITNLNAAITTYIKAIQKGATLDDSALLAAINAAELNKTSVEVANSGDEVIPSKNWVSQTDYDTYAGAINTAREKAASAKTQSDYDNALEGLTGENGATPTFNAAKQAGTKDVAAPTVTDITATLDGTTATISFTTNEAGSYKVGSAEEPSGTINAAGTVSFKVDYTADDKTAQKSILVKVYDSNYNMTEFTVTPSSKVVQIMKADGTVSDTTYETLAEAINAASEGDTVKLLKNITLSEKLVISKTVTLDLNGKTVTRDMSAESASPANNTGNLFQIESTGDLTVKDTAGSGMLTAKAPSGANTYSADPLISNLGKFTLEGGTIKVPERVYYALGCYGEKSVTNINGGVIDAQWGSLSDGGIAIGSNGAKSDSNYGFKLNINGGEIKGGEQTLYLPGAGKTNISGGKLVGSSRGIEIRAGELSITGGEISVNAERKTAAVANNGASGSYTGAIVAVKPASVSSTDYEGNIKLNISGGTFTNNTGDVLTVVHETANREDAPVQNVEVMISGGDFSGDFNIGNTINHDATDKLAITGGTFSSDPTAYLAAGYKAVNGDDTWKVEESDFYKGADDIYYIRNANGLADFRDAVNANNATYEGKTVKLTDDIDLGGAEWTPVRMGLGMYFNGDNHTIKNAKMTATSGNVGFFIGKIYLSDITFENFTVSANGCDEGAAVALGEVSGASGVYAVRENVPIKNVTVKNSTVTGAKYTGAIVGKGYGVIEMTGCKVENTVVCGQYKVGGAIGFICGCDVSNKSVQVTGNTLTDVTVKGENIWSGKTSYALGKIVGNWCVPNGACKNNTFTGTTEATENIGQKNNVVSIDEGNDIENSGSDAENTDKTDNT